MTEGEVRERIRTYVKENFLYMRPDFEFQDTDSLLGQGVVDSMGVVELIDFLHEEFGLSVKDDEITERNFDNLKAMGRFVTAKLDKTQDAV